MSTDIRDTSVSELEQKVREQTARLELAMEELESFSYSVSHDLRAPLRGIAGFARILREDHGDRLDPEGLRVLEVIRSEARRMGQLIDDLLEFSRASRQRMETEPIVMTELAGNAFDQLAGGAAGTKPRLLMESLPAVRGDRAQLRQVWTNLLGNAVKFSRHRPDAMISVTGWSEGDGNTYAVKDNGVGFDQGHADQLFGVFQRLHSAEAFEGTGVGLALVKRIVGRHGGRVWGQGTVGQGATFFFWLPTGKEGSLGSVP